MSKDEMKSVTVGTAGGKVLAFGMRECDISSLRKHLNDPQRKYTLFDLSNYLKKEERTNTEFNIRPVNVDTFIVEDIEKLAAKRSKILRAVPQQNAQVIKLKGP